MHQAKVYTGWDVERVEAAIKSEGFEPTLFVDGPGKIYEKHRHAETKLLAFLEGSMTVIVGHESYLCEAGDRLIIRGRLEHSAEAGPKGCRFLWAEKLV